MIFSICGCARLNALAMNESGQAYFKEGNYASARRDFQMALIDDPNNVHYAFNLAAAAHRQGDSETAEDLYRQALDRDPSYQPAYHGLATLMNESGRTEDAQQLLAAWAGSQPYSAESHIELAWMEREAGNSEAAEQSLRQALRINPKHEKALAQLGQVYEQQGHQQEAFAMYQRSLYLDPTQPHVKSRMVALGEQLPASVQGMPASSSLRASLPGMSPGGMPPQQMATAFPQAYPSYNSGLQAVPESSFQSASLPQMQTRIPFPQEASPFPVARQWQAPTLAEPERAGPILAPALNATTQGQEYQPTTLVVPSVPASQQSSVTVPQISQNTPEVRAF